MEQIIEQIIKDITGLKLNKGFIKIYLHTVNQYKYKFTLSKSKNVESKISLEIQIYNKSLEVITKNTIEIIKTHSSQLQLNSTLNLFVHLVKNSISHYFSLFHILNDNKNEPKL